MCLFFLMVDRENSGSQDLQTARTLYAVQASLATLGDKTVRNWKMPIVTLDLSHGNQLS